MFPLILTMLFIAVIAIGGAGIVTYSQRATEAAAAQNEESGMALTMRWFAYATLLILMFRAALGTLGAN